MRLPMTRTMIITVLIILTTTTLVGCSKGDKGAVMTNDLLHRETKEVTKVSAISQYQ